MFLCDFKLCSHHLHQNSDFIFRNFKSAFTVLIQSRRGIGDVETTASWKFNLVIHLVRSLNCIDACCPFQKRSMDNINGNESWHNNWYEHSHKKAAASTRYQAMPYSNDIYSSTNWFLMFCIDVQKLHRTYYRHSIASRYMVWNSKSSSSKHKYRYPSVWFIKGHTSETSAAFRVQAEYVTYTCIRHWLHRGWVKSLFMPEWDPSYEIAKEGVSSLCASIYCSAASLHSIYITYYAMPSGKKRVFHTLCCGHEWRCLTLPWLHAHKYPVKWTGEWPML